MMLHFFDENGLYVESSEARLDPAEMLRGREKYLMPKNALSGELPACGENQRIKRVGDEITLEIMPAASFEIALAAEVEWAALGNELNAAGVKYTKLTEKSLRVDMPATAESATLANGVITAHDYRGATNAKQRAEILARLATLDAKAIRSLRAIMLGVGDDKDNKKLAELESEAAKLRAEMQELKA